MPSPSSNTVTTVRSDPSEDANIPGSQTPTWISSSGFS